MDRDSKLGVDAVDTYPPYTATGDREIRARNVSKRHIKILDDLQAELGNEAGRREAIAALCEAYAESPERVLKDATPPDFR